MLSCPSSHDVMLMLPIYHIIIRDAKDIRTLLRSGIRLDIGFDGWISKNHNIIK
jgi:hypothetical protein